MIKNFTKSIINHAVNGFSHVTIEKKMSRLEICKKCENYNVDFFSCDMCGCFLNVKTGWASEKCPIDKWGPDINGVTVDMSGTPIPIVDSNSELLQPQVDIQLNQMPKDCGCNKKNV